MPAELSSGRRRARKFWRRIRSVVALLPPIAFQWVRHLIWHGTLLPVSAPRTYTHRLFLKMARDRNPLLQRTSDKLALRGYVQEKLGPGYLPELYRVLHAPEELLELELPPRYVVKATHGSGMNAIVRADEPAKRAAIVRQARRWLAYPYWRKNGEWGYRGITPRIIVEEFLDAGPEVAVPRSFGAMRQVAECLAREFDFVRVDLYALGERIVVGELTHYPTGGSKVFEPPEWDAKLGALWPESRP